MTTGFEDAIAVVGIAGRFPGAADVDAFWANTLRGATLVTRHTETAGAVAWARAELDDIASFDPAFFGMSPRDALLLDPQHRLLLECAWEAMADATPAGRKPIGRTAVFAGANYSGYRELLAQSGRQVSAVEFDSGVDKDFLATTIAYRLGLHGPCLTVQTACSSSLVAVHLASQALLEFDADQALAGGVSIVLPNTPGWRFEPSGIHSQQGTCRPFDADADGTVMGDGAGLVVLRRLDDAIADGCRIYAVIRGSAVNNDGSRKVGYTAPSVPGQAEVIRAAQVRAGVGPEGIGYIEAHGTGTPLGDRVEFQALLDVFTADANGTRCALGSAKGAIGHLDVAAGVAGLIRAALSLYHQTLPGTVNHRRPHPGLGIDRTRFFVPTASMSWPEDCPRRAGVNSFGIGGTNAHVILEQCPPQGAAGEPGRPALAAAGYQARRYWPAPGPAAPEANPADPVTVPVEYRRAAWREWSEPATSPHRPRYARIILLADADGAGDQLSELLRSRGNEVIRVGQAMDLIRLLREEPASGRDLLVCALALVAGDHRRPYDLLTILAAECPGGSHPGSGLDVVLLTRHVYPVIGTESGDPALAALTGLARVLSMEARALRIRVLDLAPAGERWLADAADAALRWQDEPLLARRGRRWWHQTFESVALPVAMSRSGPAIPDSAAAAARSGMSVVIGLGQVGAASARALAHAPGTLALVARPGAGTDRALALKRELESATVTVLVEECDPADPVQLDALLARLSSQAGVIDRVIMAAGISGDRAYQDSADLPCWRDEQHFKIKVTGTAAVASACTRYPVRRVVLMSSLAGVLGAISLGPYSAASAAMDCYAAHSDGLPAGWLSIGWDAWQHDAPRGAAVSAIESRMVRSGLTSAEVRAALPDLLLSRATGHVLVIKGDFAARWDRFVRQPLHRGADGPPTAPPAAAPAPPSAAELPLIVLEAWRRCLEDPNLRLDDDLLRRGADSLNAIDALAALSETLGVTLPSDLFFEAQTPRLFASHIASLLAPAPREPEHDAVRKWGVTGPLIWCLPPISGNAEYFEALADLLGQYRVRAVTGEPLAEISRDETIDAQAARYYDLLTAQDEPAAAIVGWSYGAVVAFELAQLVSRATPRRPSVLLLDIPAPGRPGTRGIDEVSDAEIFMAIMSHRIRQDGHRADIDLARRSPDGDDGALMALLGQLRATGVISSGVTQDTARRLAAGYRYRMRAIERYRPVPYAGRLLLLLASEAEFGDTGILRGVLDPPDGDPSWGWSRLAGGGCTVEVIAGHHAMLLRPPLVEMVADAVRRAADGATTGTNACQLPPPGRPFA